jgi:hypothetical protein
MRMTELVKSQKYGCGNLKDCHSRIIFFQTKANDGLLITEMEVRI